MNWYIQVNGQGVAIDHLELPDDSKRLTSPKSDKTWFKPATLNKPTPGQFQTLSGPVYDINAGTITYTANDVSLSEAKELKYEQLATLRFNHEVGGVSVGGVSIDTDRETQGILTAGRIYAKEDNQYSISSWKVQNGVFSSLNAATIIAVADAVAEHVQDCFDREKAHSVAISALTTVSEVASYDTGTGWPS